MTATMAERADSLSTSGVSAAILAGMVAMSIPNVLPYLVGVIVDHMALDSRQAGFLGSADIAGLALGSVLCTGLRGRSLRAIGMAGLGLLTLANVATIFAHSFELLLAIRFASGFGGGFALAICYAVLGAGNQARNFAIFNVGQIGVGWVGALIGPSIVASFGWQGLFLALAALGLAGVLGGVGLPHAVPRAAVSGSRPGAGRLVGTLTVASVLIYFTGQGGAWAYLDPMGALGGLGEAEIAFALSWCLAAGMAASLIATWLDLRLGLVLPLLAGFVLTNAGLIQLGYLSSASAYLSAVCLFVFGWNVIVPYQFAAAAKVDGDGRLAMLVSTASVAGLALGPALAAPLAEGNDFVTIRGLAMAMNLFSLALLVPALRAPTMAAVSRPDIVEP